MNRKPKREGKKPRTRMTGDQIKALMACFQDNPFPSTSTREELSRILSISPRTVQIWFQNQRQRIKNQMRMISEGEVFEENVHKECPGKLCILAHVATRRMEERHELDLES
ncbi:putative zinc finger domain-containing protein [Encephalitozoon romaleae SJ-2008]|uniref:Zinc finger domain-containing protein n=1 Tax=Encephalitozoon romaleae (strain SJ-2008) TaxID=1178016 RepID=I7AS00_ENCRO|nr:putative zinc finger domain-containing protein [Encephalitozoon romaleae SJ-2008]AFN83137.1 putative zinc finger domain-containing protein [Encephalitozoon romaleae SJ-2008]